MSAETEYLNFQSPGTATRSLEGDVIASATTIAPTHGQHRVSGTTAIVNITVPYDEFEGEITLIPTGLWSMTNAGNIALAVTAVVSKALKLNYSRATSKWYPSYT